MAILNLTTYDPILKQHYSNKRIFAMAALKNALFAVLEKKTNAGGKFFFQPVDFEDPIGGSADLSVALTNTGASSYEDFHVYRKKNYQVAKVDNETIEASQGDANAFMPAMKEISRAFRRAGRRYGIQVYRPGGGYCGRLESGTTLTGAVANLDDHADCFNFQKGSKVGFSADPGTGSLRGTPTYLTVSSINREGGTVTFTANLNTVTGIADTDYMFFEGDHASNMQGLADWVPDTAPTSTLFCNVDRTQDVDRLGGLRRTCAGEPLLESLIKMTATSSKHGADPDLAPINPEVLSDLLLEMEGKVSIERTTMGAKARDRKNRSMKVDIGFDAVRVNVGGHDVDLLKDVNCPTNRLYVLQMDTWTIISAGPAPQFLNRDGLLQRGSTSDDYEVRVGGYANLSCSAPGFNHVGILS